MGILLAILASSVFAMATYFCRSSRREDDRGKRNLGDSTVPVVWSPSLRLRLITIHGSEVIDDEFVQLRQQNGEVWPYCTL